MRIYVHVLMILALVLAGVSPACAFISGQTSLVEICTTQGIEYKQASEAPAHGDHQDKKSDCMFCFAQAHGKSLKSDTIVLDHISLFTTEIAVTSAEAIFSSAFYNPHGARAPPILL